MPMMSLITPTKAPNREEYLKLCKEADIRIKQDALNDFHSKLITSENYEECRLKLFEEFNKSVFRSINLLESDDTPAKVSRKWLINLKHPFITRKQYHHFSSSGIFDYNCDADFSLQNDQDFVQIIQEILDFNPDYIIDHWNSTFVSFKFFNNDEDVKALKALKESVDDKASDNQTKSHFEKLITLVFGN